MTTLEQLKQHRKQLGKTLQNLSSLTGMSVPQVSNVLGGKVDARVGTVEALADAMGARLVLVPKHLLPDVERLLSGKTSGADDIPSTIDRFLGGAE